MASSKEPKETQQLLIAEAMKETIKARIAGRTFKMKEFAEMELNPDHYEAEILRWKTALEKTLAEKESAIAKTHHYLWGVEDKKLINGLPQDGVPSTKKEFEMLMKYSRLGPKWRKNGPKATEPDANFNEVTKLISGGAYSTWAAYQAAHKEIHKAVETARYIIAPALNNEMSTPFMRGQFKDYNAVMEWIEQKTSFEKRIEYMADIFKKLSTAFEESNHTDTKCLNYRMVLEQLYIDKELEFPDWEIGDRKAEICDPEAYTPALSFIFLWRIYCMIDEDVWKKIEDEFRSEIGNDKYNREGWQKNKPRLYKIIDKYTKNGKNMKAHVKAVQQKPEDSDSDEIELEMEDGTILKVQPKSANNRSNWRQNFTKKFGLRQNGQRWKSQNQNQGNNSRSTKKIPDQNGSWSCRKCSDDGKPRQVPNTMKCPIHKHRPGYLKQLPLNGKVNSVDQQNENQTKQDDLGSFNSITSTFYGDTDTE